MPRSRNESDVYYIPPNFIEGGTLTAGSLARRNLRKKSTGRKGGGGKSSRKLKNAPGGNGRP